MPRERWLILGGTPCDINFYEDGPKTVTDAIALGKSLCPYFDTCISGGNHPSTGFQCLMRFGINVAQYVTKQGNTVDEEVNGDFHSFFMGLAPPKGYVWSPDRKEFIFITNKDEALAKVREFANLVVTGQKDGTISPSDQPTAQNIGPDFEDVVNFATTQDGAIDLSRMQQLEGRFGSNGGRGCDVRSGPCSCGAWH